MTDQEIYEGIARKDNRTFVYLYDKYQEQILRMVKKNNGNADDARDIFQEGLIALWVNIQQGKFAVEDKARISTYLYALCRNIWISRLRKKKTVHSIHDNPQMDVPDQVHAMEQQYDRVRELEQQFAKLGEACKKLLTLFYYRQASLREIAQEMDITEKTAKNTKYRCMQNLRSLYLNEKLLQ